MLIPSNEVINDALTTARQKLTEWGLEREDSVIKTGYSSCVFQQKYTKLDFEGTKTSNRCFPTVAYHRSGSRS